MTRRAGESRYNTLLGFLQTQEREAVTLTLAQVEAIIGGPLPNSGHVDSSWWRLRTNPAVRGWEALGWRAVLDTRAHAVTFRRISPALKEG